VNGRAFTTTGLRPGAGIVAASAAAALGLAGCGGSAPPVSSPAPAEVETPLLSHVHGAGFDPEDGALLVATHNGLFVVDDRGGTDRVGPVIDLMGFVVHGSERLLASGHPGPGVDLPQPVGLIESTDGGLTWQPVSRQGESDFHALTAGGAGILGYDGQLRRSPDGEAWEDVAIPAPPAALAASPAGPEVLAATSQGVLRSTDGGSTWSPVSSVPLLQVVAWADEGTRVVGVEPSGRVWASADGGLTWRGGAEAGTPVQAVAVASTDDGTTRIAVVTTEAVLLSQDDGQSFEAVPGL
jgi:hypothetical protein